MDDIDGTGHYEPASDVPPPSLLAIVLDTNPYAWSTLASSLTLSKAVADLLVFINAHLAFNHANRVAVIASHCGRAAWLYPSPSWASDPQGVHGGAMSQEGSIAAPSNPNKYRPFALIEHELLQNLQMLFATTNVSDLKLSATSTMLSGALTLALSYINKTIVAMSNSTTAPSTTSNPEKLDLGTGGNFGSAQQQSSKMTSRVILVSASGDLASQYIPMMNLIFAAQHSRIPIDILKLAGDTVLLQQASYTTSGVFLSPSTLPTSDALGSSMDGSKVRKGKSEQRTERISLLPILLFAFLPDPTARQYLVPPTGINVDFRAACFCHRRVVDIGFVCSICLSIFCEEGVALGIQGATAAKNASGRAQGGKSSSSDALTRIKETGACLTCGTTLNLKMLSGTGRLSLNDHPKNKKKKNKRREGQDLSIS